jgi:hypothetical protein
LRIFTYGSSKTNTKIDVEQSTKFYKEKEKEKAKRKKTTKKKNICSTL